MDITEIPKSESFQKGFLFNEAVIYKDISGKGLIALYNSIESLRSVLSDKPLKDFYKQDFEKKLKQYKKISTLIILYTPYCHNHKFSELDIEKDRKRFIKGQEIFFLIMKKLHLLWQFHNILMQSTKTLKNMIIPSNYWDNTQEINKIPKRPERPELNKNDDEI